MAAFANLTRKLTGTATAQPGEIQKGLDAIAEADARIVKIEARSVALRQQEATLSQSDVDIDDEAAVSKLEAALTALASRIKANDIALRGAQARKLEAQQAFSAIVGESQLQKVETAYKPYLRSIKDLGSILADLAKMYEKAREQGVNLHNLIGGMGYRIPDSGLTERELFQFVKAELLRLVPVGTLSNRLPLPGAEVETCNLVPFKDRRTLVEEYEVRAPYVLDKIKKGPGYVPPPPTPMAATSKVSDQEPANLSSEAPASPPTQTVTAAVAQAMSGRGKVTLLDQTEGRAKKGGPANG
jgi:hypothetical protein